ncbi:MAG: hypothetical protein OXT67_11680 [Zetaproteobacteria bacterium]|nr:hypothetical protein [Zetaproteobacteria bacterium]
MNIFWKNLRLCLSMLSLSTLLQASSGAPADPSVTTVGSWLGMPPQHASQAQLLLLQCHLENATLHNHLDQRDAALTSIRHELASWQSAHDNVAQERSTLAAQNCALILLGLANHQALNNQIADNAQLFTQIQELQAQVQQQQTQIQQLAAENETLRNREQTALNHVEQWDTATARTAGFLDGAGVVCSLANNLAGKYVSKNLWLAGALGLVRDGAATGAQTLNFHALTVQGNVYKVARWAQLTGNLGASGCSAIWTLLAANAWSPNGGTAELCLNVIGKNTCLLLAIFPGVFLFARDWIDNPRNPNHARQVQDVQRQILLLSFIPALIAVGCSYAADSITFEEKSLTDTAFGLAHARDACATVAVVISLLATSQRIAQWFAAEKPGDAWLKALSQDFAEDRPRAIIKFVEKIRDAAEANHALSLSYLRNADEQMIGLEIGHAAQGQRIQIFAGRWEVRRQDHQAEIEGQQIYRSFRAHGYHLDPKRTRVHSEVQHNHWELEHATAEVARRQLEALLEALRPCLGFAGPVHGSDAGVWSTALHRNYHIGQVRVYSPTPAWVHFTMHPEMEDLGLLFFIHPLPAQ